MISPKSAVELERVTPQLVGFSHPGQQRHDGDVSEGFEGIRRRSHDLPDAEEDEEDAGSVRQDLPTTTERRWSFWIVVASVFDVIVSTVMVIVAFRFGYGTFGCSLFSLGFQALSHLMGSTMLVLRFGGELSFPENIDPGTHGLLRRKRRRFLVREQIGAITMGLVMLISAAGLLFNAFRKIKFWSEWYKEHDDMDQAAQWATEFLSWYGFSFYLVQAIFRFVVGRKMRRSIIWHGFWSSVVSLLFLFVLGFSSSYQKEWSWKAEPIAAIGLAFATLVEAVRIIICHLDDMDTRLRFDPRA